MANQPPPPPLDIPLGRGLAEGVDPKVLPFGAAARLDNFEVTRMGAITKRRGFGGKLTAQEATATGAPLGTVARLFAQDPALYAVAEKSSDGLLHLYAYSEGLDRWADLDTLPPVSSSRRSLVRLNASSSGAIVLPFGRDGRRFELVIYGATPTGGSTGYYYRVLDAATGSVIVREVLLTTVGLTSFDVAVAPCDGDAWVFYVDGTGLRGKRISGSAPTTTTTITLDPTVAVAMVVEASSFSSTELVVAWAKQTASTVLHMVKLDGATATATATQDYDTGDDLMQLALCLAAREFDGVHVAWTVSPGTIRLARWDDSLSLDLAPTDVETALVDALFVGVEVAAGGGSVVLYDGGIAANQPAVIARSVDSMGSVGPRRMLYRCRALSGPRRIGSRVYAVVGVPQQNSVDMSWTITGTAHAALFCLDEATTTEPPLLLGHLATLVASTGSASIKIWPTDSNETTWVTAIGTTLRPGDAGNTVVGADRLEFTLGAQGALHHHELAAPLLLVGGGLVVSNDGSINVESGFLQAPQITSFTKTAAAGLLSAPAPGLLYLYRCRYEWTDDAGQLHVSPWSDDFTATLEDPGSATFRVTLTILCTSATRRGRSSLGVGREPRITIWRSLANGASAAGDVVFYRLKTLEDSPLNDPAAFSITVDDDQPDTFLLSSELGQIVTPGELLEPLCPPASAHLCVHRDRVWIASAEDGREIWPSRLLVQGEAPAFPYELVMRLAESPDTITALASLDDKLVVLTPTRVYYIVGDGPADNGQGQPFGGPWLTSSEHGCTDARSLVGTPEGLFFLASSGICRLDQGLSVSLVSEPVKETLEFYPLCLASHHDPARSRAVWLFANDSGNTRIVVYDYLHEVWSIFDNAAPGVLDGLDCMALWDGAIALSWGTNIRLEGAGAEPGWDLTSTGSTSTWPTGVYETPWICPAGPNAYQRARSLILLGEKLSNCQVRIEVFVDFNASAARQTKTIDLGSSSVIVGLPLFRYELPLEQQACQALKIRITDLAPPSTGEEQRVGLSLQRLGLTLENETGTPRLDPKNRGGGDAVP